MTRYNYRKYLNEIEFWFRLLAETDKLSDDYVYEFFECDNDLTETEEEYFLRLSTNLLSYCEQKEYYNYCITIAELKNKLRNEVNKTTN